MQNRYGYFQRANGVYYAVDLQNKRQTSLQTRSEAEAKRLTAAAERKPARSETAATARKARAV